MGLDGCRSRLLASLAKFYKSVLPGKNMFDKKEAAQLIFAVLLIAYLIAFINFTLTGYLIAIGMALIILLPHVIAHKIAASYYIAESRFRLLEWRRYWFYEDSEFKFPFPAWLVFPIVFAFLTKGLLKFFAIETCEITWKHERRLGRWFSELQEDEIAMIALVGPLTNLLLTTISAILFSVTEIPLFKEFAILNTWFALFTLLPIGNLDGTKILFGGKIRWTLFFIFTLVTLVLIHFINIYLTLLIAFIFAVLIAIYFLMYEKHWPAKGL